MGGAGHRGLQGKEPLEGATVSSKEREVDGSGNDRCEEAADGDEKAVRAF